jgi:predicted nucleotidyltransferase
MSMPLALDDLRTQRADILAIARRHGASNLRVFGSIARGEADNASDLDLLVDMEPGRTLGDLVELERDLSVLLGCRVEAGTTLRARVRARVEREAVLL